MHLKDALKSTALSFLRRPSEVLPAFFAETAYQVVVQSVTLVAVVLAYLALLGSGRIRRVLEELRDLSQTAQTVGQRPGGPGPAGNEALLEAYLDLGRALVDLATPTVLALVGLAVVGGILIGVGARAAIGAAKVHTALGVMRNDEPIAAAIRGTARDLLPFLGLTVVQAIVFGAPTVIVVCAVLVSVVAPMLDVALAAVALVPLLLLLMVGIIVVVWPIVYVVFLFVPEAIAVDEVGLIGGVRRNFRFVLDEPQRAILFVLLTVFVQYLGLGVVGFVLRFLGMSRAVGVLWILAVAPALGLLKMGLYVDAEPPYADADPYDVDEFRERVVEGLRRTGREFGHFLVWRSYLVLLALALFAGGGALGWLGTSRLGVKLPESERSDAIFGAFGNVPLEDTVNIAANNWLVAIAHSFGGLAFGIPSVTNLLFNGLLIGALAGLTPLDLRVFAALIAPHGIVEIPALSVSGGLGLYLGWQALMTVVGRNSVEDLADHVHTAFYVLVGLLPVFVVASIIETWITPLIGKAVRAALGV